MSQQQPSYQYPQIIDTNTCDKTNETWLKAFLIDDTINRNSWQIPDNALRKYVDGFKGRPLVIHPSGDHPKYQEDGIDEHSPTFIQDIIKYQDKFKIGDIIDVKQEPLKENPDRQAYFAYIRLTDPEKFNAIKQGASSSLFVSPLIFDLDRKPPGQPTVNFLPLHLAIVNEPAYGNVARLKAFCNGEGQPCINALKKAATELIEQVEAQNSYFVRSAANNQLSNNMSFNNNNKQQYQMDPNYPGLQNLAQIIETAGIDPNQPLFTYNSSTNSYQPITTSKTTKTKKVDQQGNLITETQDFRPAKGQVQQQQQSPLLQEQQPQPQVNQLLGQTTATTQPTNEQYHQPQQQLNNQPQQQSQPVTQNTQALPEEVLQRLKDLEAMKTEFDDFKKFKQTQEERQMLAASEAQRQTIDQAFMPLFPDEGERQQVTDFFVSLNVNDDQLQKLLDFVTKGTLNTDNTSPQGQGKGNFPPKASGGGAPNQPVKGAEIQEVIPVQAHVRRKGGVKGASLVMSSNNPALVYDQYGNRTTSKFSKGILGDINWENLL